MSIEIRKAGLHTSLVNAGVEGYRRLGIGPGGAMDMFALKMANYLVGNGDDAAVIEMHFPAAVAIADSRMIISITGVGFDAYVNDQRIMLWKPLVINSGAVLRFEKNGRGARAYLAVDGGWQMHGAMGPHKKIPLTGYFGKLIKNNERIESTLRVTDGVPVFSWGIAGSVLSQVYRNETGYNCVAGPEIDCMSDAGNAVLTSGIFKITTTSNRMAYRLTGPPVHVEERFALVSSPVDFGTLQLLPDGNLIVLMAAHQTTGGYPRVAFICSTEMPRLAQSNPGDLLSFRIISFRESETAVLSRQKMVRELKQVCHRHFNDRIQHER